MNKDVVEAVRLGQQMSCRMRSTYEHECVELALDEVLRHPEAAGDPRLLLGRALAHARTHLRRRRSIQVIDAASDKIDEASVPGGEATDRERRSVIELDDWICRSSLRAEQQLVLRAQLYSVTTTELAETLRVSVPRVRERIARARSAAHAEWLQTA
ncbi:hypothetical protein ACQPW3_34720 [Actinosynnema sp. CA-248983]